jgi:hypothetical protein
LIPPSITRDRSLRVPWRERTRALARLAPGSARCVVLFNLHPAVIIGAMVLGISFGVLLSRWMVNKRMDRSDARR